MRTLLPVLGLALVGCTESGPRRHEVSGTVTFKGKPVPNGTVFFMTEAMANAGGASLRDGAFRVPESLGLIAGVYKVAVSYPDLRGVKAVPNPDDAPVDIPGEAKDFLPAKYNSKTQLTAEVTADGPNVFRFDLD